MPEGLRIGQVAGRAGVRVETVRFYEREGLIPPPRREPSGYRRYPEHTPDTIRFVQRAKALGFTLRESRELLALREQSRPGAAARAQVRAKLEDIERRLRDLEAIRQSLRTMIGECEAAGGAGTCPILHTLQATSAPTDSAIERCPMAAKRQVEVFSAGCPACENVVQRVQAMACPSCEVTVRDMHDPQVIPRARELGVQTVPAVAVDGRLALCCAERGLDEAALRAAGLGQPRD